MSLSLDKTNWKPVQLSEVVDKIEENDRANARDRFDTFIKVEHMEAECLHLRGHGSQEDEELPPTFYKIFRKGQILFPTRNPHLRRTAIADCDGICGEKTLTLAVNDEVADPRLIPFLFHSRKFYDHSAGAIIGSTNPHCRWRDIANYEFLLPLKHQQEELVELLFAADTVAESSRNLISKLEATRAVYLSKLFSESKAETAIGDISDCVSGFPYKSKEFNTLGEGRKLMRGINIKEGEFLWDSQIDRYYNGMEGLDERYFVKPSDILVPMDGSKLGYNYCIASDSEDGMLLVQRIARFRVEDPYYRDLLFSYLASPYFRSFIAKHNTTTAIPHISLKQLRSLKLPKATSETSSLLSAVKETRSAIAFARRKQERATMLLKSLINEVF